ncbi:MAG: hypothetical protein IJH47_00760 [Oscillospiraceae bacterium]|nr:hypothetical protein [Oscillospiraceae bacterium]
MKKKGSALAALLDHVTVSLALVVAVLVVLDIFNPRMGFLSSTYSRAVIVLLAACSLTVAVRSIRRYRRARRKSLQKTENDRRSP